MRLRRDEGEVSRMHQVRYCGAQLYLECTRSLESKVTQKLNVEMQLIKCGYKEMKKEYLECPRSVIPGL